MAYRGFMICGIQIWHYLTLFSQSEVPIPNKIDILELYHVMKQQDSLSSDDFHIENESIFDYFNIKVRNRTKLYLAGYEWKVYQIEKYRIRHSLSY